MDQPSTKSARIQSLRDRWHGEPLANRPPALDTEEPPATCHELMSSPRTLASFANDRAMPEAAGLTPEQAEASDRAANAERFGTEDPAGVLATLGGQFDSAIGARVDPDLLRKALVVIDVLRTDGEATTAHYAARLADPQADNAKKQLWGQQQRGFKDEAEAMAQAEGLIEDLMAELGITIPLNRGVRPKR